MQDMVDTSHESVQFAGVQWKKDKFKNSKFWYCLVDAGNGGEEATYQIVKKP